MGTNNKSGNKNLSGIAGIITAVGTVATVVTPLVEKAIDSAGNQPKERTDEKVKVPELYHKGFPIDLEQAINILEDCGLKNSKSKLTIKDANPRYKDYSPEQVIDSNPKQGTVVKIGSTVCLKYIPNEVIVESQKIFDEMERSKADAKAKKTANKLERKERTKENIAETVDKAKQGVKRVFKKNNKERSLIEEGDADV